MRQNGLEAAIKQRSEEVPVFGICGGYQMLGFEIRDPAGVEEGGNIRGMELMPVLTVLKRKRNTVRQRETSICYRESCIRSLHVHLKDMRFIWERLLG